MTILFCNIGWMKHYDGMKGDSIQRGGPKKGDAVAHEICNFTASNGRYYGYVQPTGRIAIERLGADKHSDHIEGVTVIWTAGPDAGGTVIVGWYKNATIFREIQKIQKPSKKHRKNGISEYLVVAKVEDSYLVPASERDFFIPRGVKGGVGQSNIWYADRAESAELVSKAKAYINSAARQGRLPDIDAEASAAEGNQRLVAHLKRERKPSLVKQKKEEVLSVAGKLCCEVCEFDFEKTYGEDGRGFCEVHHLKPISKMNPGDKTTLADLAVICSNCHRIIHRINPMPSIEDFRKHINKKYQ